MPAGSVSAKLSPVARTIIIRIDDVGRPEWSSCVLLASLVTRSLAATCLVVPEWIDSRMAAFLRTLKDRAHGQFEVGQHGWRHENHAPPGERRYEFGPSRGLGAQRRDIRQGRAVLNRYFGSEATRVFSPPHDRLSQETVQVLAEEGFEVCLGSPRTYDGLTLPDTLRSVVFAVQAGHCIGGRRTSRSVPSILDSLMEDGADLIGLVLHPQEFTEPANCLDLLTGLDHLRAAGVRFETAGSLGRAASQGAIQK